MRHSNFRASLSSRPSYIRLIGLVAVLMTGAATVTIAGMISVASATSVGHHDGRIIHLRTTVTSAPVNSAGNGGPGDVIARLFSFETSTGTVGHADISCTIFTNAEQLCHAAFVFPDGQIDAQAAIPLSATTSSAAVIGGTGAYEGASGHVDNVMFAPGVIDRTITLLRPHR
jgi:hypothetical protein